jgi:hypothetical protein
MATPRGCAICSAACSANCTIAWPPTSTTTQRKPSRHRRRRQPPDQDINPSQRSTCPSQPSGVWPLDGTWVLARILIVVAASSVTKGVVMARRSRKRVVEREALYWQLLASGAGTVEACRQVGIGRKTGYRWRAEQGGIRPWVRPAGRMGQRMAAARRTGRRQEKLSSERAGTRLCHSVESFGVMRSCANRASGVEPTAKSPGAPALGRQSGGRPSSE